MNWSRNFVLGNIPTWSQPLLIPLLSPVGGRNRPHRWPQLRARSTPGELGSRRPLRPHGAAAAAAPAKRLRATAAARGARRACRRPARRRKSGSEQSAGVHTLRVLALRLAAQNPYVWNSEFLTPV